MSIVRHFRLICLLLGWVASGFAQCPAPHYSRGRNFSSRDIGSLYISLHPRDLVITKLACLAKVIKNSHPKWVRATVLMFTSLDAARHFRDPGQECPPSCQSWADQLHALYVFDRSTDEDDISIMPMAFHTPDSLTTTIELPLARAVHCAVELYEQCIMAAGDPAYPYEILKARGAGMVQLTGTLSAQGTIVGIVVKQTEVNPHEQVKGLEDQAVRNLRSWQVEPARDQRAIPVEITYAYTIDNNLKRAWWEVKFELPTKVIIRGNPELLK